jgi:hypothetical protein
MLSPFPAQILPTLNLRPNSSATIPAHKSYGSEKVAVAVAVEVARVALQVRLAQAQAQALDLVPVPVLVLHQVHLAHAVVQQDRLVAVPAAHRKFPY